MGVRRDKQLWNLVKDIGWDERDERLLKAMCVIVAAATAKKSTRKAADDPTKLPFGPGAVHLRLLNECSDHVNVATYDRRSFGRFGKTMGSISDLRAGDLDLLVGWLNSGAVDFWNDKPTWSNVMKHFPDWIGKAREWGGENGGTERLESRIR